MPRERSLKGKKSKRKINAEAKDLNTWAEVTATRKCEQNLDLVLSQILWHGQGCAAVTKMLPSLQGPHLTSLRSPEYFASHNVLTCHNNMNCVNTKNRSIPVSRYPDIPKSFSSAPFPKIDGSRLTSFLWGNYFFFLKKERHTNVFNQSWFEQNISTEPYEFH